MNTEYNNRERSRSNSRERKAHSKYRDAHKNSYNDRNNSNLINESFEVIDRRYIANGSDYYTQNKKYSGNNKMGDENTPYSRTNQGDYYNYSNDSEKSRYRKYDSSANNERRPQDNAPFGNLSNSEIKNIKIKFRYEKEIKEQQLPNPVQPKKIAIYNSIKMTDPRFKILSDQKLAMEKLNLVLDLDETLINSVIDSKCVCDFPASDLKEIIVLNQKSYVLIRPHALDFLEEMSKYYNLFAYSHGEYKYVETILELIDKDKKYIRRDKIFKNRGQVTSKTSKSLKNLEFTDDEMKKTIILDDQKIIWEDESKKVIPSKKYAPLRNFMDPKKFKEFLLFRIETNNYILSESQGDSEIYTDGVNSNQLLFLKKLFKAIFEKYNICKLRLDKEALPEALAKALPSLDEIYVQCLKQLLIDYEIEIMIESSERRNLFTEIAKSLGAKLVIIEDEAGKYKPIASTFLIVEKDQFMKNHLYKNLARNKKKANPNSKVISAYWLIECYFSFTLISESKYEINNI